MVSWWHSMGTCQTQREILIWKCKNFNLEHTELSQVKGELPFWNHIHKKIEQQSTISESTDTTPRHIVWRSSDNRIILEYYIVKTELENYIKEESQTIMVSANIRNNSVVCYCHFYSTLCRRFWARIWNKRHLGLMCKAVSIHRWYDKVFWKSWRLYK